MEKLIDKFVEIFPGVSREAAEGSILNIINSVGNNEEVAIPEGQEEPMGELLSMVKEFIEEERATNEETSGEATSEAEPTLSE